mmetsp:Transcript_57186/g.133321  ORF Transcript_57186/g.133321 Transcript_57186/m.133321 type:complete len:220 (-) Transcript_57186:247-906(-)
MAPWKLMAAVSAFAVCLHTICARRVGEEEVAELTTGVHSNSTGLRFPSLSSSSSWFGTDPLPEINDWPAQAVIAKAMRKRVFVFLEVFRLKNSRWVLGGVYHSHLLICNRSAFDEEDTQYLGNLPLESGDFAELPEPWWSKRTTECEALSYRNSDNEATCSGVKHWRQSLHKRDAKMWNALGETVKKYYYGELLASTDHCLTPPLTPTPSPTPPLICQP